MKVEIKYLYLNGAIELLYSMSLQGKLSRHRSRIIKVLRERLAEVGGEEIELMKEYAELDESGESKLNEQGVPVIDKSKIQELNEKKMELFNECMVIEGGDMKETLETVKDLLLDYQGEISGQTAEIYDYLCTQFENGEN